ncbi:N-acetylglucosamine kinase [Acidicapsa acidisoli]|uniref:N-acetylglucosamine kinase n=1 Tax=Acidicapsa acidisoli TaxID=1615681 RepID=UPI0021DFDA7F|nr:BadF/BadG/BcrA/BcrD ATPase family protein [Acidicapsa acidisoli]
MPYFLAVDAGGTKTEFALADEERELLRVRTGAIQRQRVNEQTAQQNLDEALSQLESLTGVAMQSVRRSCVGTSGITVPVVTQWLREAFAASVGGELLLIGDVEIALDACFPGARGVLVLAGTGSNIAGRSSDGTIVTAGGWGPALADQGSGHFIGREALRRGFLAIDQERPTTLLTRAMQHWKLPSLAVLIEHANTKPSPDFSALAPLVVAEAADGDPVAQEVLKEGGQDLAYLAGLVIQRIRKMEPASNGSFLPPPVAVAGSILGKVAPVREALTQSLRHTYPDLQIIDAPADPITGALWRARQGK